MWLGVKAMKSKAKPQSTCRGILRGDEGATAVEYALMIALVAAVLVVTVHALGRKVRTEFRDVTSALR